MNEMVIEGYMSLRTHKDFAATEKRTGREVPALDDVAWMSPPHGQSMLY